MASRPGVPGPWPLPGDSRGAYTEDRTGWREVRVMVWEPIRKGRPPGTGHNLADYDQAVREFSWAAARAQLAGLPGGRGINIAHEAVDQHAAGPHPEVTALRCIARDGRV